jgi:hypothetical protein
MFQRSKRAPQSCVIPGIVTFDKMKTNNLLLARKALVKSLPPKICVLCYHARRQSTLGCPMVVEDMQDRLFMVGFGRRRKEHKSLW